MPAAGLDFLAWLDEGLSLGEARQRFETRHNPFPEADVLELARTFQECDFIAAIDDETIPALRTLSTVECSPQKWAQVLISSPVLIFWMVFVGLANALWLTTPALWPRFTDYFWIEPNFVVVISGLLLWLVAMPFHELAHWVACQAKGIDATITWTQRLGVIPMSQTVMHTIWAVPRPARFLPLAAGMAWDIFVMSTILYPLLLQQAEVLSMPLIVTRFFKFCLLTYVLALLSQFWLFSRMDGYFLLSALLGQRNLQSDTYAWLKSRFYKSPFDPPAGGMRFVYAYALITLLGGGLFVGQQLLFTLPIKLRLIWESIIQVCQGTVIAPLSFANGIAVLGSQVIDAGLLAYAYWRRPGSNLSQKGGEWHEGQEG